MGSYVAPSLYGSALYGVSTWGNGTNITSKVRKPSSRSGQVFKFGCRTTVNALPFALNEMFMQLKIGRIV